MTQRNPMNERYTSGEVKGQTRKSAASAKPVTKAAASVHIQTKEKPKKKGFFAKAMGGSSADAGQGKKKPNASAVQEANFYNPPTERYKRLRRIWWIMLAVAVVFTAASFALNMFMPDNMALNVITLVIAYGSILGALYLDFVKIRKERDRYREQVMGDKSKAAKRARKEAAERAAAEQAEAEKRAAERRAKKEARKVRFGLGKKKDETSEASTEAAEEGASEKASSK